MPLTLRLVLSLTGLAAIANSVVVSRQQQQQQLKVAFACESGSAGSLPAQVWLTDPVGGAGRWHSLPVSAGCPTSPSDIVAFCRLAYPHIPDIVNVQPSSEPVTIPNWCPGESTSNANCLPLTVTPQRCLTRSFKPESLLVPDGCSFGHRAADNPRDSNQCHKVSHWYNVAGQRCTADHGLALKSYSQLLPCDKPGKFAGVEYVCCPPLPTQPVGHSTGEDKDREVLQHYLALPTEQSVPEDERYMIALGSLGRVNEALESRLESRMSLDEDRAFSSDHKPAADSVRRLLSEILPHYRLAFRTLQRQEMAERRQLDSVHEDRLKGALRASLQHLRRLLDDAIELGKSTEALGYLRELARLTAAEATRVANQAVAMETKKTLSANRLEAMKRHLAELRSGLEEGRRVFSSVGSGGAADRQLQKPLDGLRRAVVAVDRLKPSPALSNVSDGGINFNDLAARFSDILRRHEARDRQRVEAMSELHAGSQGHHLPDDRLGLMPLPYQFGELHGSSSHSAGISAAALSGALCGCAALLLICLVVITTMRGRGCPSWRNLLHRRGGAGGSQGYKLTLVDEQPGQLPPHSSHLASMQANGYENPTYKFYEG